MTNHLSPEEAFAAAAAEFDGDEARPGLLAMAEAQADGDPARTRAAYLRLRAAQLSGVPPAGTRPTPPVGTPRPAPQEPKKGSFAAAVGIVAVGLLAMAALAFWLFGPERDAEGDALADAVVEEAEPVPEPVVVSVDCASTRQRVGGSGPGALIGSAVGSLVDDPAMEATVTVRNAGAPGEVVVAVAAFSEVQGGALGREQTVALAAGERRQLTFTFDPTPFSRGGACRAWTAPVGDALADFDAFVETYNAIPEPREAPRPAPPPAEPEPLPDPAPAPPEADAAETAAPSPPTEQPPRTPQPDDAPPEIDAGGDAAGGL